MPHRTYDLNRSRTALDVDSTLIAVVEMSQSSWLVHAVLPGVDRRPMKKLPADETGLLSLLNRWRDEAEKESGRPIRRICVAYEAGRDGFWLARWLRDRGIEAHVMHATSIPVKRDHRRAKTDRLDCLLLMRAFLGWLRGEEDHCRMVAVPTIEEEDARRTHRERKRLVGEQTKLINRLKSVFACLGIRGFNPKLKKACERLEALRTPEGGPIPQGTLAELKRAMARLALVRDQIREIDKHRQERIGQDKTAQEQSSRHHATVGQLATIHGLGLDTADMLAGEVFFRDIPDRRALARYGGLTGSPDESGRRRREKGLARAGNPRVRNAMIQFAWRFLMFQPDSELARWYRKRTGDGRPGIRKTMIVALARKLLVALWKFVTRGEIPEGVIVKPAN